MFSHIINISQPHNLTKDEAYSRLLQNMLSDGKGKDPNVDWDDIFLSKKNYLADLNLLIRGVPVRASIRVESNAVTLKTSLIEGLIKAGIALLVEPRIKAMLAAAISKPLPENGGDSLGESS